MFESLFLFVLFLLEEHSSSTGLYTKQGLGQKPFSVTLFIY